MNDNISKPAARESARALLKRLQEQFPVLAQCSPLAIGIDAEILAALPETDRKQLRAALRIHTGSTRYLKSSERGEQRFNLSGEAVAPLSQEHRERAATMLKERFQRRKEEEKARQQAAADSKRAQRLGELAAKFGKPSNR